MAIPVLETFTRQTIAGSRTIDLTKPTGVVSGDLLLLIVVDDPGNRSDHQYDAITGWTLDEDLSGADVGADVSSVVFWREADGTEGATETADNDLVTDKAGWYIRISGANTTAPFDVKGTYSADSTGTSHVVPGVTTTVADCLAMYYLGFDGGDGDPFSVSGTGWSQTDEQAEGTGAGISGCFGEKDQASAGATGDATVTSNASDGAVYVAFAIAPAAAGGNAETLAAVATGVATLTIGIAVSRVLAASATGVATVARVLQLFQTLTGTATGIAALVAAAAGQFFETLAALATGVATVNRRLLAAKTLGATATGVAALTAATVGQFFETIAAVGTGVATLNRRLLAARTLTAISMGVAAITLRLTLSRALAAVATGTAVLARRLSAFRTLAATATVAATVAASRLYNIAIAAVANVVATVSAVFSEAEEEPTTPFSGDAGIRLLGQGRWRLRPTKWRKRR